MTVINVEKGDITNTPADALVLNLFEGVASPEGGTGAIDKLLGGTISELIKDKELSGKLGETTLIHSLGKIPAKRILVMGLGKREQFSTSTVRTIAGHAARYLRNIGVKNAISITHGAGIGQLDTKDSAQAIAEGVLLGLYEFKNYQTKKTKTSEGKQLESFILIEQDEGRISALKEGIARGVTVSASAQLARDLVNEPANVVNPVKMAQFASSMAKEAGLPIEILVREDLMQNQMGAMLAVSAGTANEPQLIIMEYLGDPDNPDNNIALVGKGITFDSGGISIKPSANMWEMKGDMSGGASVIGAMKGISQLKPKINVYGVVPAVENMPSGTAQRPGDIIRSMNGKTIEVDNTDAEGRLILADAITYIRHVKNVNRVVDIATLTGAIVIALGHVASGVMGTSQTLVDAVIAASKTTDEKMWQLPLFDEYKKQNHSDYADVKNTGGRPAGSITAALFIGEFTEGVEWAHLDIAGTFLAEKTTGHLVRGASGVPTRTLIQLVEDLAKTAP